jgi:Transposase, Mutator family
MIVGLFQQSDEGDTHDGRRPRMTAAELADKLLRQEHADVLLESVAWMARDLMEAEVSTKIGAGLGERSLERTTHRNGYRSRDWDTRVGAIELAIPKLRQARTSPASWSRAGVPSRRWSRSSKRLMSTACRPARSTGWWSRWACTIWARTRCRGCAAAWTSRSGSSASGPWRAPTHICGWTPTWSGSTSRVGCATRRWSSPMACTPPAARR